MKKSFKRFLSSVLATVMAVAGMSIGMTSTAMAAAYDNATVTQTATSKTWDFSGNTAGVTLKTGDTVNDIVIGTVASTKLHASGYFTTKAGSTISIPVPANSTGKLTIVANATQSARYATLEGTNIIMTKGAGASADFTIGETADGYLDLSFAGGEFKALTFTVDLTTGSFGEVATYTLTGACSGLAAGTKFDLVGGEKTYEATVNTDGASYTVSTQAGAFDTTVTYTANIANYTASYDSAAGVTLTVDAADATKFTATPAITFTEDQLAAIPAGTYTVNDITAGKPNFDISALTGSAGKYTGDIKFILSDIATVTLNGKCGSSDAAKSATATIGADTQTAVGGGTNTDYVFSNVAAGETTLTLASSNTTFQVVSITIAYGETSTESTESTTEGSTESTEVTTESTEATTEAPIPSGDVITDKAVLTATDAITTLTADTAVGQFTLMTGISADKNAKSVEGVGEYGFRIKSNGKTTLDKTTKVPTNRAIKFATSDAANLQVIAMSGSSSAVRDYAVYASDGTIVQTVSASGTELTITNIALPKADTYYIACPSAACNFYSVNVVVGGSTNTATGGKVIADQADSYVFATLSAADMAAASMDVKIGDQTDAGIVNVYESAVINGQLVTAKDLGADYLYVIKVAGTNGMAFDFTTVLNAE